MKKDKIIVSRFDNGYSVEFIPADSTVPIEAFVFEIKEDGCQSDAEVEGREVATFVEVLQCVDRLIGPTTGGFSPKVIRIVTEKGDELE